MPKKGKGESVTIAVFMIALSLLGLGFLVHGIIKSVPLTFGLGLLIVWTAIIPKLIDLFKKKN